MQTVIVKSPYYTEYRNGYKTPLQKAYKRTIPDGRDARNVALRLAEKLLDAVPSYREGDICEVTIRSSQGEESYRLDVYQGEID